MEANELRWPFGSRIPAALLANVTLKLPTAVVIAVPSLRVKVATAPDTETEARVTPVGGEVSVQGLFPAVYGAKGLVEGRGDPVELAVAVDVEAPRGRRGSGCRRC